MKDTDYWIIAIVLLGFIAFLYFLDLVVFLMSPVPAWYFASDEADLESAYYSLVNKETMNYIVQSFPMLVIFGISFVLFFLKNKYGFYLAALGGVIYLVQAVMAIMQAINRDFGGLSLLMGAFLIAIAIALLFCVWKSKTMFGMAEPKQAVPVAGNTTARKKSRTSK